MAETKLQELLAVEKNYENQAGKTRSELQRTFTDKKHLFAMKIVTFKPNTEGSKTETESQSDIQTTVKKEIEWLSPILAKALDASHQIDVANTIAKADVVTEDGETLLSNVPATSLLRLEHRLDELRNLIVSIPTLDPAKGFLPDDQKGPGYYKAAEVNKHRTKKEFKPVVIVPPTVQHPAQVEKLYEDVSIGNVQEQEWSSMITPAKKAQILDQLDKLSRAVKKARARANEQEVDVKGSKIGQALLDYIFKPLNEKAAAATA